MEMFQLGTSSRETAATTSPQPKTQKKRGRPPLTVSLSQPLRSAEDVAEGLRQVLTKSARSYLAIGKELARRKKEVGHGEFSRLFKDHRNAIANPLPMSLRQAQRHMQVANDQRIRRHFNSLPSDLDTLGILTHLSNEDFERGILSGQIHDSLTRAQAMALDTKKPKTTKKTSAHPVERNGNGDTAQLSPPDSPSQRRLGYSDPVITRKIKLAVWRMFEDYKSPNERAAAITALDAIRATLR
jgi:hypothetical protein